MGLVTSNILKTKKLKPNYYGAPVTISVPTAGIHVDERTALTYSAVWCCVRVISGFLMSFPWRVYRPGPNGGREAAPDHPANRIIDRNPNSEMTSKIWTRDKTSNLCTWGNGYSELAVDSYGRVAEAYPIDPERVNPDRTQAGNLIYDIDNLGGPNTVLPPDRMFHARGLGHNPLRGYSVIRMARETISLGLAAQRFGCAFFGNGARPSMTFEHPTHFQNDESKKEFEEDLQRAYGGGKAQGAMVLQHGIKAQTISVPPEEAQFLETRQFQVSDVGIWFGVPPVFLGDYDRAKFANMEQMQIQMAFSLMMYIVALESEADWKLFTPEEREAGYYTRMNMNALLRADTKTRGEFYKVMTGLGAWNPNRVLELEDENPIGPEGDLRLVPMNMVSLEKAYKTGDTGAKSEVITPGTSPPSPSPARRGENDSSDEEGNDPSAALEPVFRDGIRTLVSKEIMAVSRKIEKQPDEAALAKWMMDFYDDHERHIHERLFSACTALASLQGMAMPLVNDRLKAFARLWVCESRERLGKAQLSEYDRLRSEWARSREGQLYERLMIDMEAARIHGRRMNNAA